MNITFPVLPAAVTSFMQVPFRTPGGILYHSTDEASGQGRALYRTRFPPPPGAITYVTPTAHRQTTLVFTKGGGNPSLRDAIQVGWRSFELPTDTTQAVGSRLIYEGANNVPDLEEFVVGPHAEAALRLYLSLQSPILAPPVGQPRYEFIFMLIPCLYVATVWLRGNNGQNLFYSLQPATFYRPPAFEQPATPIGGVPARQYFEETQYFAEILKLKQRRHL